MGTAALDSIRRRIGIVSRRPAEVATGCTTTSELREVQLITDQAHPTGHQGPPRHLPSWMKLSWS